MILSILKVLAYLTELHLMRGLALARGLPVDPLPRHTAEEKRRLASVVRALWSDWRKVLREDRRASQWPRPILHARRYLSILGDLPAFLRRKRAGRAEDLAHLSLDGAYPAYYLKNYHYQTDGYFTEASALRYDHQMELLFIGMGHLLRKIGYSWLRPYLRPGARVLEFGAGTGTSGDQFKAMVPEARLTLLDLSPAYLSYAARTYPGRFEATRQGAVEALEADAEYDAIFSCFTMHELPRSQWDQALSRVHRALKPGGHLLIVDSQQDKDAPENRFALDLFERDFFEPYYPEYRRDDLEGAIARAGFRVLRTGPVMFSKAILAVRA